ncbi:MAG: UbiX family flavin prenyltransferase [Acidobacteriota bacterium]
MTHSTLITESAQIGRELALLISGASGMVLAARFATMALEYADLDTLHLVITSPAAQVLSAELGPEWASAHKFRDQLKRSQEGPTTVKTWSNDDLGAPISSGSNPLIGTVVLPCSAGTAGAVAHGISRGLLQRAADVALKQRWPLILGIRESPMSEILLENLLRLAKAGATIMPPLPAFYLSPDPQTALEEFIDHYCLRILDLLGIHLDRKNLRWRA